MGLLDSAKDLAAKAKKAADTNKDGKIDAKDLNVIKKHADLNKDGKVDSKDVKKVTDRFKKK